jgi:hypothetical protein
MAKKPKKTIKSKSKKSTSSSPKTKDTCPDGVCPIKKPKGLVTRFSEFLFGPKDS